MAKVHLTIECDSIDEVFAFLQSGRQKPAEQSSGPTSASAAGRSSASTAVPLASGVASSASPSDPTSATAAAGGVATASAQPNGSAALAAGSPASTAGLTVDDIRKAGTDYISRKDKNPQGVVDGKMRTAATCRALMKEIAGVEMFNQVPPDKAAAMIAAFQAS